jgi:hypothetical protein
MIIFPEKNHSIKPVLGVQLDRGHPLAGGLVGCWLFNEGGGNVVQNLAGFSRATFVGTPTWGQGRYGQGLSFPGGSGSYVGVPFETLQNAGRITLAAWVKTASGAANTTIIDRDTESAPNRIFQFTLTNSSANLRIIPFYSGAPVTTMIGSASVNDGKWHHVAAVLDGVNARLYVDGVLDFTVAETRALDSAGTAGLRIGAHSDGSAVNGFDGQIDEVLIWNRGLSYEEIQWLVVNPFDMVVGTTEISAMEVPPIVAPPLDSWHPAIEQPYPDVLKVIPY